MVVTTPVELLLPSEPEPRGAAIPVGNRAPLTPCPVVFAYVGTWDVIEEDAPETGPEYSYAADPEADVGGDAEAITGDAREEISVESAVEDVPYGLAS